MFVFLYSDLENLVSENVIAMHVRQFQLFVHFLATLNNYVK